MIRGLVRAGVLGLTYFSGGSLAAAPEPLLPFIDLPTDIKSQPLADALTAWAQLTGYQIVVPQSRTAERITSPIKGNMTAQESMDRLLAGTGLIFERINDRTVAIKEDYSAPLPIEPTIEQKSLLASVERIEVTGSRLFGDIRADGSVDTAAPIMIFDRKKLDETGISSVSELMKFIPQQPYARSEATTENGAQYAEMRGFGFDTTLVLINGRRSIPSSTSVAWNAFDLNTLPLAAVERVEVLSDSASAVYGADAIGGVINIITKRDIPHPVLDVHYGSAAGGAEERQLSLSTGYAGERLRASAVLDYFERGTLLGAKRDRWNNQDFDRFDGADFRALTTNPGNVSSLTSANLPGVPSRFAAVPTGSTGVGLTPEDFLATAGQRSRDSLYRFKSVVPEIQRRSVVASAEFDLAPAITAFGEFLYADDGIVLHSAPPARTLTVPATNPFNPFGVPVVVDYLFDGVSPRYHAESERYRTVVGLQGTSSDWDWELSVSRIDDTGYSWGENGVDTAKVNAALAETDPAQSLNVFRDGPGGSAALLASLIAEPTVRPYVSKGTQGAGVLRGRLITLPAGDVATVLGGEWLRSDMLFDGAVHVARGRSVAAGFAELRLPLVSSAMQIPAVEKLSLTLAARYDRYSDFGDSFNSQYGLVWAPAADLTLRASYGTAFRAPSLFELYASRVTVSGIPTPDPLRNNELSPVTFVGGGNPNLEAVAADSLIAGFDLTPSALQGLKFSASYWRINIDKRVNALPYDVLAENWERFPDRAIRAERTPEDIAAGLPGKLVFLDLSRINSGTTETSGIDMSASYALETRLGRLSPMLSATWIDKYQTVEIPGIPTTNRLGIADVWGTIARWKAVATLGWQRQSVSVSATARYTAAYADVDSFGRITGRVVPSQTLVDLQGSLDLDQLLRQRATGLPELQVTAGVSNLFDEQPNFAEVGNAFGYDATQGDLRQRFGYLRLSAHF